MRQLVTVRTVRELVPIEGADRIELAKVDGWQCVVKKGDFHVGDPALYFEIDSLLPEDDERWAFLEQRKFRVKTMRLRGVLSQGLLMPMRTLTDEEARRWKTSAETHEETLMDILRVQKYEPPTPLGKGDLMPWPSFLQKTDQERIQNIPEVLEGRRASEFEITEKLDGTSCTFYHREGSSSLNDGVRTTPIEMGACSRNCEHKLDMGDDVWRNSLIVQMWFKLGMKEKLMDLGRNIAIQGEIIGPRVQGNRYKRGQLEFYVFDIYNIDEVRYLFPEERTRLVKHLDLLHVPVLDVISMSWNGREMEEGDDALTLDRVLQLADGKSQLYDTAREGIVFKEHGYKIPHHDLPDSPLSFKAISNKFLLKNE